MIPLCRRLLGIAALLAATQVHAADVCKWTDENGGAQFGDCRLAPARGARVDARPAAGDAPAPVVRSAASAARAMPASAPAVRKGSRFPPAGTPGPAGWTSTCEKLAHRIMDLPRGTPYQSEADQILQGCPGITYHCEFSYQQPETNRCGPIVRERGLSMINTEYVGYPDGVKLPTYKDVQAR